MHRIATRLLHALLAATPCTALEAQEVLHVAPEGSASGKGTVDDPLDWMTAIARANDAATTRSVEIRLADGVHRFSSAARVNRRGTAGEAPLRILAAPDAEVVLRGSIALDPSRFERPTAVERTRLAADARDRILVMTIEDEQALRRLRSAVVLGLTVDGAFHLPSRFPNEGDAKLAKRTDRPEVSPPAVPLGKEDYGVRAGHPPYVEAGKAQGWLGSLDEPRGAWVGFGTREDEMAGTWQQWAAELARNNRRNQLTGFLDANWLQRSQPLVAADAEQRSVHLSRALAYGWGWRDGDMPFHVFGMLCELDAPGEWHFDPETARLFLYPPVPLGPDTEIELPIADGFLHLRGTRGVVVRGLQVEQVASGTVFWLDGEDDVVAGCTVRDSTASAFRLSGRRETVTGCDAVDCNQHVVLAGGKRSPDGITAGDNVVDNCHLYQRRFGHRRVGVAVSGVGNTLRHCLIHNSLGQSVTVSGNDHLVERNELCNIGYEEGDGGAIYAGGDLTGYGVVYRHNFFHHLMHVPGKVERSGIHLDDLQAGATCIGNVFYKSAGKGIFMNGGAGHVLRDNVFLAGYRGIYNVGHGAARTHALQEEIFADPEHEHARTKENYVGRAERIVGTRGWTREPWRSRYPRFFEVMEDAGEFGRLWPIRCEVVGNWFLDNAQGDRTIWSRVADTARAKSVLENDRTLTPEAFVDYDALDLRFRAGLESAPEIPFAQIGLRLDEHRTSMPDKQHLRSALREFFRGVPCMPGTTRRIDTGEVVERGPVMVRD